MGSIAWSHLQAEKRQTLSYGVCTTGIVLDTAIPYSQIEHNPGKRGWWCCYSFTLPFTTSKRECCFSLKHKPAPELYIHLQLYIPYILCILYVYIKHTCMLSL